VRINLSTEAHDFELVVTRQRWYDTRARKGGYGAIDLVMHLWACTFNQALERLKGAQAQYQRRRINPSVL
jgi:hypothetical protein